MFEHLKEFLSTAGGFILFLLLIAVPVVLLLFLSEGGAFILSEYGYIVESVNTIIFVVVLLSLLLSTFASLRSYTGPIIFFSSYIAGFIVWLISLVVTYILWGLGAVVVGLLIMGIGVFPIAILALLFAGETVNALMLLGSLAIIWALRFAGLKIADSGEKYKRKQRNFNYSNDLPSIEGAYDQDRCSNCGALIKRKELSFCPECGNKITI